MRSSAVIAAFIAISSPAAAQRSDDSRLSAFDIAWTRQAEIVDCVPSREHGCRIAALVLPQTDDSICIDALVSEAYRLDTMVTVAVPIVVEVTPVGQGPDVHGTFYKALALPAARNSDGVCVPKQISVKNSVYRISVWQPAEQVMPPTRFPLDVINATSARLGASTGGPTKGLMETLFGMAARPEGRGALEVRISAQGHVLDVLLDGSVRAVTNIKRYLTYSQIRRTSVVKAGKLQPLSSCDPTYSDDRWSVWYKC